MTKKCRAILWIPGLARHFFCHAAVLSLPAVLLREVSIINTCDAKFSCATTASSQTIPLSYREVDLLIMTSCIRGPSFDLCYDFSK